MQVSDVNFCFISKVCKTRHFLTLRSELSTSEHDLSSTYFSSPSEDSMCSDEDCKPTECEAMINMEKTDKVHEILDKVRRCMGN